MNTTDAQAGISKVCDEVEALLLEKNHAYGNSALDPVRIFSRASEVEQINVRIDDKLSRVARGSEYAGDDTELDLIGYLILRRVARRMGREEEAASRGEELEPDGRPSPPTESPAEARLRKMAPHCRGCVWWNEAEKGGG